MVGALTFNNKKENSYVWVNVALGSFAFLGFLSAVLLFIIDKSSSELRLNAPIGKEKAEEADEDKLDMDKRDPNIRNKLKRSIARSSMAR